MSSLIEWRDALLARIEDKGDPYVRAVIGARYIRQIAFMAWCPACQDGDHFNHDVAYHASRRPPVPEEGGCWSLGNRELCRCPWRERVDRLSPID